ncbi:Golgi/lysosome glycoprotein 1 [Trypanosoma brucei equiperdum]|uniref:Golgi/lysosome glycoprotein 1 n=1 Tax=Trypanosoma brucei equiperdum TaxID=630700 RepID=A0A3L6L780_9TRYP|nr:Golgi/lysosome glycoprotein 1 [Trypanosoma brucei equiperdum]
MRRSFFVALLLQLSHASVRALSLFPTCSENEYTGGGLPGKEWVVQRFDKPGRNLTIHCLAYEVKPVDTTNAKYMGPGPCQIDHQTEFSFRLFVRATYKDSKSGEQVTEEYDVKDMAGGSLSDVAIRLAHKSDLSLVFANTAANHECGLEARVSFRFTHDAKVAAVSDVPVLVGVQPRIVHAKNSVPTRFIFRSSDSTKGGVSEREEFFLISAKEECSTSTGSNSYLMSHPSSPPLFDEDFTGANTSTFAARDVFIDTARAYRICSRKANTEDVTEVGVVRSFEVNPSYYQVVGGQNADGKVYVMKRTTIKFYGSDLDTRPRRNQAKFVSDTEDCDASAAGGVPETLALEPEDRFGPKATSVLWSWVLKRGGAYKVCFKRTGMPWVEVPSIDIVNSAADITNADGNITYRQPVDPVTKELCPMAPPNTPENRWSMYNSIMLTLKSKTLPSNYLQTLSKALCVPRTAMALSRVTHGKDGRVRLFISIFCEELGEDRTCDTVERQNYIISASKQGSEALAAAGIESAEGSRDMFALGDDPNPRMGWGRVLSIFAICGTVVAVACLVVYGVLKYRENRQYFVNFGVEDEDVDDMYISNIPTAGAAVNSAGTKGSVIEVED